MGARITLGRPDTRSKTAPTNTAYRRSAHGDYVAALGLCAACGQYRPCEAAHYRLGSHTPMTRRPPDKRLVPLCGPFGCHKIQHDQGEVTFWGKLGIDPEALGERLLAVSGDHDRGISAIENARARAALRGFAMTAALESTK